MAQPMPDDVRATIVEQLKERQQQVQLSIRSLGTYCPNLSTEWQERLANINRALEWVAQPPSVQPDWDANPWANYACLVLFNTGVGPILRWIYFEHEPRWGERSYNRTSGKWGQGGDTRDFPLSTFFDIRATLQQRPARPHTSSEELADAWPEMPDVEGIDRFAQHPISGDSQRE